MENLLLSPKQVSEALSISRTTIWRLTRRDPEFPTAVRISGNRVGFLAAEILAWAESRPAA